MQNNVKSAGYRENIEIQDAQPAGSRGAASPGRNGRKAAELGGRANTAELIRGRRSIDLFEAEPIGTAELRDAIELARWAPNHRLTEPWRFFLIGPQTADALARFGAEFDAARKGQRAGEARLARLKSIPGFFVLTCRKSEEELLQREDYAACCCAAQNLMLYLWQCGIGSKWTTGGMTREHRFYEIVGIDPAAEIVVGFFWYGRPKIVPSQKRKSVDEIVVERP